MLWIDNPESILHDWNPLEGTVETKLNAVTKISIIASILISIKKKSNKIFLKTIIIIGIVMIVYTLLNSKCQKVDNFSQVTITTGAPVIAKNCSKPSLENPLGNWLPPNVGNQSDFASCNSNDQANRILKETVPSDNAFYGNTQITRPFYKTPEDNEKFKEFLYAKGFENTFKQGSVYSHLSTPNAN